jgi:hypothetical protein
MEIQIDLNALRQSKIFIATPMYGGQCHGMYMKSCLDLQTCFQHYGIQSRFSFIFNESLITRARNYLVDEFLRSDFTHLLFLDADIHFNPQDIVAMLALDKEVIGAPYPKKSINWGNVAQAARMHPQLDPKELENLVGDYVFNVVKGTDKFQVSEPLEVMEIGTGYMLIKREVFARWSAAYPQKKYRPDHVGQKNFDGTRYIHAYFDTVIDPQSERYLSEDYMFCQWFRAIGGKIWLCPWIQTQHVGTFAFTGNMAKIAELTGRL